METLSCACLPVGRDGDERCISRRQKKQMLKQVQHDIAVGYSFFCHPESGPELDSGSIDFRISFFGFKNLGGKVPYPAGGVLYFRSS
jgi:hypothetical protein